MNIDRINSELTRLKESTNSNGRASIEAGVSLANEILKLLIPGSANDLKYGEDALDEVIPTSTFPNTKTETWFQMHPYLGGERVALNLFENDTAQIKFYQLNDSATKARISGSVMISPNWEDSKLTHNDEYKLGLDFFLTAKSESLLMVVSDGGNLRVMEFEDRITHTQKEILENIQGVFNLPTKDAIHTLLWDSLALSEVNKKFYEGISHHFNWLYQSLKDNGRPAEDAKLFSNRLLDRLLFLWFLRKKHIINESFNYFDLPNEDSTKYYNTTLKQLFFETLNVEPGRRKTGDQSTPYLNGGLFEAHDNDWRYDIVQFPNGYFNSLYDHLAKYNFTTDESSPEYEQVAIDPEMLGRIFENLLAEINPETEESARKQKGAFYTPREIVSYMCKESLRQYLYKEIDNPNFNTGIDDLIDKSDSSWELNHSNSKKYLFGKTNRGNIIPQIITALDKLKVLDPACGSGAFPMGMMQLLLKTYERLEDRFDPYKLKLRIIENNVFGVDIEPMAVEISRLRAWLSIVVDDEKNDHNVEPLPNLEFKFVCADSLTPLDQRVGIWSNANLHEQLAEIRSKFFNARKPQTKEHWKDKYYKLTKGSSFFDSERDTQLKSFDPFKNRQPATFFDPDYMFGEEKFDIVIGNPPYVQLQKNGGMLAKKYEPYNYVTLVRRGDLYSLFYERGVKLLKDSAFLCFITSNKWMRAGYGENTRAFFSKYNPIRLIDFGSIKIFESATVDTNILLIQNSKNNLKTEACTTTDKNCRDDLAKYIKNNSTTCAFNTTENWVMLLPIEQSIKNKIESCGTPLKNWDIKVSYGVKTGLNDAFIIDTDKRNELLAKCTSIEEKERTDLLIRPILRGKDIKRYKSEWQNLWVILAYFGSYKILETRYPVIYNHLLKYEDDLKKRGQVRSASGRIKAGSAFPGQHHWLELDNNPSEEYLNEFNKQKILYPCIMSDEPKFVFDEDGKYFTPAPGNIITGNNIKYLLKLLCSLPCYYALRKYYMGGGIEGELKTNRLLILPVPVWTGTGIQEQILAENEDSKIDDLVAKLYGLDDDEYNAIKNSQYNFHH